MFQPRLQVPNHSFYLVRTNQVHILLRQKLSSNSNTNSGITSFEQTPYATEAEIGNLLRNRSGNREKMEDLLIHELYRMAGAGNSVAIVPATSLHKGTFSSLSEAEESVRNAGVLSQMLLILA